jgi:hypothetical protein
MSDSNEFSLKDTVVSGEKHAKGGMSATMRAATQELKVGVSLSSPTPPEFLMV